ncbi:MAG: hypothetical protein V1867_04405 [Candidatus Falkowbacteria bacterium]
MKYKIFSLFYGQEHIFSGMKDNFLRSFYYRHVKIYSFVLLAVNAIIWLIARFIGSNIDTDQIALHYNVDFGIDYYGDTEKIYIIPLLGLIIIVVNFFLYVNLSPRKDRKFISHILLAAAGIANIILLTAIVSIYLVNFR